jgi:hypothetical protein
MVGELDAGKPHVQFDEGAQETCDSATRLCPTLRRSPSCGGSRRVVAAWGEPARPGFPPEGKRERGSQNSLLPQAELLTRNLNLLSARPHPHVRKAAPATQKPEFPNILIVIERRPCLGR